MEIKEKTQIYYQQFMFAFAIPARAFTRPGPETTRHTPGLETKRKASKVLN